MAGPSHLRDLPLRLLIFQGPPILVRNNSNPLVMATLGMSLHLLGIRCGFLLLKLNPHLDRVKTGMSGLVYTIHLNLLSSSHLEVKKSKVHETRHLESVKGRGRGREREIGLEKEMEDVIG